MRIHIAILVLAFLLSCQGTDDRRKPATKELFTHLSAEQTGISFKNVVKEDTFNNLISNFYIYNGAGVSIGDINNDGLEDIYFVSNQNQDRLYLNRGNLKFEDITLKSGISNGDGWSTGVTMVDINNDGWLDIFVSKSSPVKTKVLLQNKVYINLQNNTFKESSKELGLAHYGFSVQHYFIDYDRDGDLDIYLIDHQMRNLFFDKDVSEDVRSSYISMSNQLFRNDNGHFSNVTSTSFDDFGIYPSLSAAIGDFNNDYWPDIYVCNDFLLPDQLFINDQRGGFTNQILEFTNHTSSNSMGSDYADINNDLFPDLIVLDMLASDHIRSKENMTSMNSKLFDSIVDIGYHKQYMSNVLQLNTGINGFQEIGQLAGINSTDWSWGALMADFNNDGFKDIFVSNGVEKDIDNRDFRNNYQELLNKKQPMTLDQFHNLIPSSKQMNHLYTNNKDLTFKNISRTSGLSEKLNSNGAAYADLDNDGDLDLVLNNINSVASVYRNNSVNNYIKVSLKGPQNNRSAVGAKVLLFTDSTQQITEVYPSRGFQSAVSNSIHFGISNETYADSLIVIWDHQKKSKITGLYANTTITLDYSSALKNSFESDRPKTSALLEKVPEDHHPFDYVHTESDFDDFGKQLLLPQKQSTRGSHINVADFNNDGLEDIFLGNAAGQSSAMYRQRADGTFESVNGDVLEKDKASENLNSLAFDADNDGDLDLYVVHGSYEFDSTSIYLNDALYLNDGKGNLTKSANALPNKLSNNSVVIHLDIDNDGDQDLFVGGREVPGQYPIPTSSYFLENTNGHFQVATDKFAPDLNVLFGINDAIFSDFDQDGDKDLIVVGEWSDVQFLVNKEGVFRKLKNQNTATKSGWYLTIEETDVNKDGYPDYVLGNYGKNNKFQPSVNKPLHVYANDFDNNGSIDMALSKDYHGNLVPVRGLDCSSEQNPFIKEKLPTFKSFAHSNMSEIYGHEMIDQAYHAQIETLESSIFINKNGESFINVPLPNECQVSPIFGLEILDVNQDGFEDIIGVGNYYDTEVETISYDAGRGFVLLNDHKGFFEYVSDSGLFVDNNSRDVKRIIIDDHEHLIILNNDSKPELYKLNY